MQQRKIPFTQPFIEEDEIQEVVTTLKSGWLTTGPKVAQFEEALKSYIGCRHVVALSSCSAAQHLALKILDVKPGDEIITTPLTFISTVSTIFQIGAKPILADIDSETLTINPQEIEKKITPQTKGIIPVHYGGHPCMMDAIISIAKEKNLFVVEDGAHAIGSVYRGKKIGALDTEAACFSFYASKNLAIGEGGALITNNQEMADKARLLSLHGMDKDAWDRYGDRGTCFYDITEDGFKYNMTDIQASIGIHQLRKLDAMNQKRREIASFYHEALRSVADIQLPGEKEGCESSWHLYPIRIKSNQQPFDSAIQRRNGIIEQLKSRGIATSVHFIPVFLFSFIKKNFDFNEKDFPMTMKAFSEIISLPLYSQMTREDVQYIAETLKEVLN